MSDAVALSLITPFRSVDGLASGAPAGLPVPPADQVVRFENSLKGINPVDVGPAPQAPLPAGPAAVALRAGVAAGQGLSSLGDRVMQSMEKIATDYTSTLAGGAIDLTGGPASTSFVHILDLQRAVIRVSIESDLASKLITKSGQIVDQLARTS